MKALNLQELKLLQLSIKSTMRTMELTMISKDSNSFSDAMNDLESFEFERRGEMLNARDLYHILNAMVVRIFEIEDEIEDETWGDKNND